MTRIRSATNLPILACATARAQTISVSPASEGVGLQGMQRLESIARVRGRINRLGRLGGAMLAVLGVTTSLHAQSVELRVLIPRTANFWASGRKPALHNGVYAGTGVRISDSRNVLYGGRLTDPAVPPGGVPHFIIETGEPMPNSPGESFDFLRFPTVWDDTAYFPGAAGVPSPSNGLYARSVDGGPVQVVSDTLNGLGPWIENPFAGAEGLAYVNPFASTGTNAGINLFTYDQQWIPVAEYGQSMPDGSVLQSTLGSSVGIGGGKVVFSTRVDTVNGTGWGGYIYDIETGLTSLIANGSTAIPGDGRPITFIFSVDTDGQQVVFGAANGQPWFGGIATICVANADGSDLRVIARTGDPYPGVPGRTFSSFGSLAVDQGLVYFQGNYLDGAIERLGFFVHIDGVTLPIVIHSTVVGGASGHDAWFDPRGVDGHDAVVVLQLPTNVLGVSEYTLVHAHINIPTPCPADFTGDNAATVPDIFAFLALWFAGDPSADIDGTSGIGVPDIFAFLSLWFAGC